MHLAQCLPHSKYYTSQMFAERNFLECKPIVAAGLVNGNPAIANYPKQNFTLLREEEIKSCCNLYSIWGCILLWSHPGCL